jgi:hypothetical protein
VVIRNGASDLERVAAVLVRNGSELCRDRFGFDPLLVHFNFFSCKGGPLSCRFWFAVGSLTDSPEFPKSYLENVENRPAFRDWINRGPMRELPKPRKTRKTRTRWIESRGK